MAIGVPKSRYNYKNDGFDMMLTALLDNITEEQKSLLPAELLHKIYRSTNPNVNLLSDSQKDYILATVFNKKVLKVIMDEENGITAEELMKLKDVWRKKKNAHVNASDLAENMSINGEFVLADRDLYEGISYMALVGYAPIFKVVMAARRGAKKYKANNPDFKIWLDNITNMFGHYESNKKRLVTEMGLENLSEWYALLHFYSGEKKGSSLYKERFKYAFSTCAANLRIAMYRLKKEGYLDSRGAAKNAVVVCSPKGRAVVDKMLTKFILNY